MDQGSPQVLHNYGTRKRQNSLIRPSLRLRQQSLSHSTPTSTPSNLPLPFSYHPRRIKPLGSIPTNPIYLNVLSDDKPDHHPLDKEGNRIPSHPAYSIVFPPEHVVLHPDDANNKVFIAMGRALLSVVSLFLSFLFIILYFTGCMWLCLLNLSSFDRCPFIVIPIICASISLFL